MSGTEQVIKMNAEPASEDSGKSSKASAEETVKPGHMVPRKNIKYKTRLGWFVCLFVSQHRQLY